MIFNMVGGGGGSFLALLNVTNCTASATVTATCGSVVYTATATSSGTAQIVIESAGTFTLTCSGKYSPSNVSITSCTTYTVRMLSVPSAYQEVEYLQCSGTQWINTLYTQTTNNQKIETKFRFLEDVKKQGVFGRMVQGSAQGDLYFGVNSSSTQGTIRASTVTVDTRYYDDYLGEDIEIVIDAYNGTVTGSFNGTALSSVSYSTLYKTSMPIMVRIYDASAESTYYLTGRMYYFKLYDNHSLVRDLIPCYRKIDSVAGMYDTVSGTLYTNAGTGTFIVGGDVT